MWWILLGGDIHCDDNDRYWQIGDGSNLHCVDSQGLLASSLRYQLHLAPFPHDPKSRNHPLWATYQTPHLPTEPEKWISKGRFVALLGSPARVQQVIYALYVPKQVRVVGSVEYNSGILKGAPLALQLGQNCLLSFFLIPCSVLVYKDLFPYYNPWSKYALHSNLMSSNHDEAQNKLNKYLLQ